MHFATFFSLLTLLLALLSPPARAASPTIPLNFPPGPRPLTLLADFHLQNIQAIDERAETFTFSGVLEITWKDPRQAFDPAVEGSSERLFQGPFQNNEVSPGWYPQVVMVNDAASYTTTGVLLRVQPDGTCHLIQSISATAQTNYNMTRMPLDQHRLEAIFEVLGFDDTEVIFRNATRPSAAIAPDLAFPQWTISDIQTTTRLRTNPYAGTSGKSSTLVVSLTVTRQPFFIVRLLAIPLFIIVMLSFSVFWLDRTAVGDRLAVSFIGLLTCVAYQNLIGDILPRISYVTLMSGFINLSFLVMSATVVVNLYIGSVATRGQTELAHRIDRHCRWLFPLVYVLLITLALVMSLFLL